MTVIIGHGTDKDPDYLPLSTKNKRPIQNAQQKEKSPEQLRAAVEFAMALCPGITLRSLSATYNCLGLVFASRRTCIDAEHTEWIMSDDEYQVVQERKDVERGDLVIYRNKKSEVTHVAVVWDKCLDVETGKWSFYCLSQWGSDGEYFHAEDEVPVWLGTCSEFRSERKYH
jgi:hypothetical protein